MRRPISIVLALAATCALARPAAAGGADREDAVEPFALDVYVIDQGFLRNPRFETPADALLFSVSGADLGVTWGEFRGATAASKAQCTRRGKTRVRIRLSGLIPGGLYSVFYATFQPDSRHPLCPNAERLLPLVSANRHQEPDPSSFVAGEDGEAVFSARVDGCLLEAGQVLYSVIYHADGRTHHPFPNFGEFVTQGPECRSSFGSDAMRQLTIFQELVN